MPGPELTDGVVTLRAPRRADVADMIRTAADPESTRWTTIPQAYDAADAQERVASVAASWRDGTAYRWAIETGGRFAGSLDIHHRPVPEIGYVLAPWARGRGTMARAVRLATGWAFDRGLPVVHWWAHAGHLASWRVAHACGFTFHGERPLSIPYRGGLRDGWFASLRPGDDPRPRTTWWPVPVLEGALVRLRAHTGADVPRIVEACSDPRTRHRATGLPDPCGGRTAREFVRDLRLAESLGTAVTWAVADRDDDRLLADVGVSDLAGSIDPTGGEIGYRAHPDVRGRDVLTEAVQLVVDHALRPVADGGLGRTRLRTGVAWTDPAARAVAERAGFGLVGRRRRDGVRGDGTVDDVADYELVAGERT